MQDQTIDKEVTSQILKFLNCDEDTTKKFQDDNIIFDENIMRKALKNSKKIQFLSSEKHVPSL